LGNRRLLCHAEKVTPAPRGSSLRFLPPLLWSAVIAWFSRDAWGAGATGALLLPWLHALLPWAAPEQLAGLHGLVRKGGHVFEYAALALLWRRALGPGSWRAPLALAILTAALDEAHQAATLTRGGRVADVLLDAAAAAAALAVAAWGPRASADGAARGLLWIAAAGGTALLAIDWAAAAPPGWLWLSVPAAWLTLWAWRWRRPRA